MFHKIFCPVDGSKTAERGMQHAILLAKEHNAQLMFSHVVDISGLILFASIILDIDFDDFRESGRLILAEAVAAAQTQGVRAQSHWSEIKVGRPGPVIAAEAEKWGADLIVMGTHGRRGIGRALLGSDATAVIGHCLIPVLLIQ